MLLYMLPPEVAVRARTVAPPHPADHGQFDGENQQRRLHHGTDGGWNHFRLDVDGIPQRDAAAIAALAREAVPDRERDRQELALHERRARRGAKRPLEDDRPLALVVGRGPGDVARRAGRDVAAALPRELLR